MSARLATSPSLQTRSVSVKARNQPRYASAKPNLVVCSAHNQKLGPASKVSAGLAGALLASQMLLAPVSTTEPAIFPGFVGAAKAEVQLKTPGEVKKDGQDLLGKAAEATQDAGKSAAKATGEAIGRGVGGAKSNLSGGPPDLKGAAGTVKDKVETDIGSAKGSLGTAVGKTKDAVEAGAKDFKGGVDKTVGKVSNAGNPQDALSNIAGKAQGKVESDVGNTKGFVVDKLREAQGKVDGGASNAKGNVLGGVKEAKSNVVGAAKEAQGNIKGGAEAVKGKVEGNIDAAKGQAEKTANKLFPWQK